ncbi:class I SAM-dependent methyltransferase [Paraburkholderia hayleyella]|uniref:class I SAM-dependent methyltransferase n=1 Tax=Paraburkholderia hayleyella TaxID=2152889 RepID=UPI001292199D|nr:class I SAM-dependent methyltransferase [Paraburkholderia hayleyella]
MSLNSTQRFTGRVADYVKYRPSYPREIIAFLHDTCGVTPGAQVADIGAGTGISARLFIEAGHPVVAVEPNQAMREAADAWLGGQDEGLYRSVAGTAEATTLDAASVDLVIAAQAFHWFDLAKAKREFARILRPSGRVALFWNSRRLNGSPFLEGYEALLQRYGLDYSTVAERYANDAQMATWFGNGFLHQASFPNHQRLDLAGLQGRLMSSSYTPEVGHPNDEPMRKALRELFEQTQHDGVIDLVYDTRIYVGRVSAAGYQ